MEQGREKSSPLRPRFPAHLMNSDANSKSIAEGERIPQQMVAVDAAHRSLAFPALTAAFPGRAFPVFRDGAREFRAEIKIAADALRIRTSKQEQSLGMTQVERAFEFTVARLTVRAETSQRRREGLELGKAFRQAACGSDPFLLFLQIFRPDAVSLLIHAQKDFV